jgi:hypothetical protein
MKKDAFGEKKWEFLPTFGIVQLGQIGLYSRSATTCNSSGTVDHHSLSHSFARFLAPTSLQAHQTPHFTSPIAGGIPLGRRMYII